jgi:6-pyruvoyltetrahydropterin/6-carboxytetrahydropterin synthase
MYRVVREITFCYGHRLLHHTSNCRHLNSHNGRGGIVHETPHFDRLGKVVDGDYRP